MVRINGQMSTRNVLLGRYTSQKRAFLRFVNIYICLYTQDVSQNTGKNFPTRTANETGKKEWYVRCLPWNGSSFLSDVTFAGNFWLTFSEIRSTPCVPTQGLVYQRTAAQHCMRPRWPPRLARHWLPTVGRWKANVNPQLWPDLSSQAWSKIGHVGSLLCANVGPRKFFRLGRDTEHVKCQTLHSSIDGIFVRKQLLRLVIRWTASIDRIDWSTACTARELTHGHL